MSKNISHTLIVNNSSSQCGKCMRGADPKQSFHDTVVGYGVGADEQGCGTPWKYITTGYVDKATKQRVKDMRPDLEFLEFIEAIDSF